MKKSEFLGRYTGRMVSQSQGNLDYAKDTEFLTQCAIEAWLMASDPREGLECETPEDMADAEMDCWDE